MSVVHVSNETYCAGFLELKHARIRWFLSISKLDLPPRQKSLEDQPYRSICINGEELDFSHGFTNLHSRCYHEILNEQGHSLEETKTSIEIVHALRNTKPAGLKGDYHPFCIRS